MLLWLFLFFFFFLIILFISITKLRKKKNERKKKKERKRKKKEETEKGEEICGKINLFLFWFLIKLKKKLHTLVKKTREQMTYFNYIATTTTRNFAIRNKNSKKKIVAAKKLQILTRLIKPIYLYMHLKKEKKRKRNT